MAPLSSLVGWDQGDVLRRGVVWEGEAAVVPRHPRVVMPRMTACYSKKDPLLDGRSPPPGSWLCQLRQSSHACWGPTCLERSGHAHQVCSPRGLHARTADKACQGRSGSHAPCRLPCFLSFLSRSTAPVSLIWGLASGLPTPGCVALGK